jgi:splicing factor 3B subunit 1
MRRLPDGEVNQSDNKPCAGRALQVEDEQLSVEELKERKIMKLLLKVKNGTPAQRKSALRQLTDKARDFGAGPLFNQILPLLMSPTLEDQERHLLVKVRAAAPDLASLWALGCQVNAKSGIA